jgi:hypothetical protein
MKNVRGIAVVLMWVFVALAVLVPATEAQSVSTSRHWRTVPQGHYTSVHYRRYYHRHYRRYYHRHYRRYYHRHYPRHYHRHFYQRYGATERSLHPVVIVTA